jgi:hypothetical protein
MVIDRLAPEMPAPIKGMLVSALSRGSDDELRERLATIVAGLQWALADDTREVVTGDDNSDAAPSDA